MFDQLNSLIGMRPVGDYVLICIFDDGDESIDIGGGKRLIVGLRDTEFDSVHNSIDGKHPGIRGRWALVVGTNNQTPDTFKLGDKVFCEELKWSRGVWAANTGQRVWKIKPEDVIAVDTDGPNSEEMVKILTWMEGFSLIDSPVVDAAVEEISKHLESK